MKKVKDLIARLQDFNPEATIQVMGDDGYGNPVLYPWFVAVGFPNRGPDGAVVMRGAPYYNHEQSHYPQAEIEELENEECGRAK